HHGDLEHLFLKQGDTKGAPQDWFQSRVEIRDRLAAGSARQIRMHHVALNRSWPDNRDFDYDIIKTFRLHPRQGGHLRTALDLKNTDRVGFLDHVECCGVVTLSCGQVQ